MAANMAANISVQLLPGTVIHSPSPSIITPASPEMSDPLYPNLNKLDQYEKIIGVRNNVSDGALLTALWVDVVIGAILVLVFVLVHTRNKIYRIRLVLESVSVRPPELPTKGLVTLYLWLRQVVTTSDLDLLATAGLDALVLCKVVGLGIKLFLPFTLVGLIILVPLHMSGSGLAHIKGKLSNSDQQRPLLSYTAANIADKHPAFWVHFVVVYIFTFYAMFLLRWQYYNYVKLREHYMVAGNDVNYWRQVLAQENPDQRFEHGKYVGALQLVRKLTRSRSEMVDDAEAVVGDENPNLTGSHVISNPKELREFMSSIANFWSKKRQRHTKDGGPSRVTSPRSPSQVSEEDDTVFLHQTQMTSSMSNIATMATTINAPINTTSDDEKSSVGENEVVVEMPTPRSLRDRNTDSFVSRSRRKPMIAPLELSNLRSPSQTSNWQGLPTLVGPVLSPHLPMSPPPSNPYEMSLPPLPPPWHLRGSGTHVHSTFNQSSLTPVIRDMKARSSQLGPIDPGCVPPSSTPAPPSRQPSNQSIASIGDLRRSGSGAWGLVGPPAHRRTTAESSCEEDPEAHLLRRKNSATLPLTTEQQPCAGRAAFNWAWWDKVNLDTEVKQELCKGRHLLSKPSVRYRTTVNTIERSGRVVAVNASQYTVLVTDVDEAPFPEAQRMRETDHLVKWVSTLPTWLAVPLLRYIFLIDVSPTDLENDQALEAVMRRRSLNLSHTTAQSLAKLAARRDLNTILTASRSNNLVPAHRSPNFNANVGMVNASGWDVVPGTLDGLHQALGAAAGEVIAGSPSWRSPTPDFSWQPPHAVMSRVNNRASAFVVRSSAPASVNTAEQKSRAQKRWQVVREAVADGRIFKVREDVVTRTFRRLFPDEFDRAIPVFRHDELDKLLLQWDFHQAMLEKAQVHKENMIQDDPDFEPMETIACGDCIPGCWAWLCWCATRVNAIEYHKKKGAELEQKIIEARKRAIAQKYTPSWFVFFKTQKAATLAAHALLHPEDNCKFQVHPAPGPENVNWEALWFGYNRMRWRRMLVLPLLLTIVLLPISIFSGALSELDAVLCSKSSEGKVVWQWYCSDTSGGGSWVFRRLLTGWLPSLLLNLYQNMVIPRVMYYIAQRESYSYSLSGLDARVLEIYFYWDFFNVFLGGVLGQLIIRHLRGLFKSPGSVFSILGVNLPYASNFFFSYIWFRGLVIIPFRLLIPHPGLFCWLFKLGGRCGCAMTRREQVQLYETRSVRHGVELGILMLVFLVGLAYCVASPLLASCTLIYFLFAWVFWRYILLYVFVRKYESGGSLWPWVFNRICVCLVVFQFFTACVLVVKQAYLQGSIIMFTLPLITLQFARQCNQSFAKGVRSTPLELAHDAPAARIHPSVYIPPPMQPSLVGWYPEWMKAWEGWGAVSYTT